ncbi:MAG: helix-turn-helix domain-containing protein [Kiritimatiellae bacterium]|nr:helix-turn-helix domain-containing protein [Kiritimatiellia bacterium]
MQQEFEKTLRSFERTTGLTICLRDFGRRLLVDGRPIIPEERYIHDTPFCWRFKHRNLPACSRSDGTDLIPECEEKRDIFLHTCHAKACEIIIPIFRFDELLGVVFIGQFALGDEHEKSLRRLPEEACAEALALARMLRSYVSDVFQRIEQQQEEEGKERAQQILRFLDANLQWDPSVGDLARHLFLSPSRTSHLVKEETGRTFRELKEDKKLTIAKQLLANSSSKVAFVAAKAGFADPNYFCRFFKTRSGMTPSQFRRKYGQPELV